MSQPSYRPRRLPEMAAHFDVPQGSGPIAAMARQAILGALGNGSIGLQGTVRPPEGHAARAAAEFLHFFRFEISAALRGGLCWGCLKRRQRRGPITLRAAVEQLADRPGPPTVERLKTSGT
jgi:hypothetical protein